MPLFSEFDKQIIRLIAEQTNPGSEILGKVVKDVLFKSGKSAFVICGDVNNNGLISSVSSLLALADGGFEAQNVRKTAVSFVSLINYLVENNLVYVMGHDSYPDKALFYQDSDTFSLSLEVINSIQRGQVMINTLSENLDNGSVLTLEETVSLGYPQSIACRGITLSDGNVLANVGISHKIESLLANYLTVHAYPTLALSDLINNDFKSPEEITAEKSIYLASQQVDKAQKTLIVAIITLLASLVLPFISTLGICKCAIAIILVIISFTMGYVINKETSESQQ